MDMKTKAFLSTCIMVAAANLVPGLTLAADAKPAKPSPMIVKDSMVEKGGNYSVEGVVYNPDTKPIKNVVIKYRIWKKWLGQDGHGAAVKETGGLVTANVKAIPPKQSTEFTATGGSNAPVVEGQTPDPLEAEISADWAK
jgi:hypothetical protein